MMHTRSSKLIPVALASGIIGFFCLVDFLAWLPPFRDFSQVFARLEWMSYDWRVRQAMHHSKTEQGATNLAAVFIDDDSLSQVNRMLSHNWPWPRKLHGRLVERLKARGAKAVAFDILFQELHSAGPNTDMASRSNGTVVGSDQHFADCLHQASNVVLVCFGEIVTNQWKAIVPADLFRTNALALGHASSEKDPDGVLRRAKAYYDDPVHGRLWHLGIRMAAIELGLDLSKTEIQPRQIRFHGPSGVTRTMHVEPGGFFYIPWTMHWNDRNLLKASFEEVIGLDSEAEVHSATPPGDESEWRGKLVFVGSIGSGSNISDLGPTPLARETYLVSKHWNVANALLTGRFVRPAPKFLEVLAILVLGIFSALVTWRSRAPWPTLVILTTAAGLIAVGWSMFLWAYYWIPLTKPVLGGLVCTHLGLVVYQVFFEQREKRHVKQVFARLVSPDVVHELLEAKTLNLGGARQHITVMFTDVRGFTEMTDAKQEEAEAKVRTQGLSVHESDGFFNASAQETLATVNDYLAAIADVVKTHRGTLDKYIGDCVMAFWGAPMPNPEHSLACVQAAIDAQWAIYFLNQKRAQENQRRQEINASHTATGQAPLPLLPVLSLGTGINTGHAIVGLMGSQDHILNYTVFGRDVNVASRLESVAGRGKIIIGEATYLEIARLNEGLAQHCMELPAVLVKGIRTAVKVYEVPWKAFPRGESEIPSRTLVSNPVSSIPRRAAAALW